MNDAAAAPPETDAGRAVAPGDPRWLRLRDQIQTCALQTDDFVLASGRPSRFLFQLRQTTLHPEGSALAADMIVDFMTKNAVSCIGGLALGAVPLVASVATMSHVKGAPVQAFFVRKEPKAHGALERIDGFVGDGEVLLIDDVATTGGSILKALQGLRAEGRACPARRALVIVDRQEGATEALAAQGIALYSLFKKSDFLIGPG